MPLRWESFWSYLDKPLTQSGFAMVLAIIGTIVPSKTAMVIAGMVFLFAAHREGWFKNKKWYVALFRFAAAIVVIASVLSVVWWGAWRLREHPEVQQAASQTTATNAQTEVPCNSDGIEPAFANVYPDFCSKLGKLTKTERNKEAAKVQAPKATVIWLQTQRHFFILQTDSTMLVRQDVLPPPQYYDWKWLRKHFHPPKKTEPFWGGLAYAWENDKTGKEWRWIGKWPEWQCTYGNSIVDQEFEHGLIVGVTHRVKYDDTRGEVLVFLHSGNSWRWEKRDADQPPAKNLL